MQEAIRIRDAKRAFVGVYVHKLLHDNGRLDEYRQYAPEHVDCDADYEAEHLGLYYVTEKVWGSRSYDPDYDSGIETLYFSDSNIMEYYRLCREYGKRRRVKLSENPYMLEAQRFVDNCLGQGCPVCDYRLQTKVNHDWASGIVFKMWPEFEWRFELLTLINHVFGYYKEQLQKLKQELEMPYSIQTKEAA
jgi:hypothetical protein